ncbi:ATP-binding cassette domain-containing protein [Streptomyces sp. NPDC048506]|uniref:ATP-binding cassette domain-containing protein n=1 Tax=Streptomyces sp. NPDC048506 TaxID=3155028 RepID=UPI00341DFD8A
MDSTSHGAAVSAVGFGVKGPRGWAFRDVDITAGPGSLIAVQGPSGSGRTCLLLALTGRMKSAAGGAEVGGLPLPKKMAAVRSVTALAHVPGVAELDPALTVGEHLRERALLQGRFGGSLRELLRPRRERRAEARALVDGALKAAGLDLESLPKGIRTSVRDLERLEALRLSVALALIGGPRLLAVDDTDLKLSDEERAAAWAMLRGLAAAGTTVLAVCSEPPEDGTDLVLVRTGDRPEEATTDAATTTTTTTASNDTTTTTASNDTTTTTDADTTTTTDATNADTDTTTTTDATNADTDTDTDTNDGNGNGNDTGTDDSDDDRDHDKEGAADALAQAGRA